MRLSSKALLILRGALSTPFFVASLYYPERATAPFSDPECVHVSSAFLLVGVLLLMSAFADTETAP